MRCLTILFSILVSGCGAPSEPSSEELEKMASISDQCNNSLAFIKHDLMNTVLPYLNAGASNIDPTKSNDVGNKIERSCNKLQKCTLDYAEIYIFSNKFDENEHIFNVYKYVVSHCPNVYQPFSLMNKIETDKKRILIDVTKEEVVKIIDRIDDGTIKIEPNKRIESDRKQRGPSS